MLYVKCTILDRLPMKEVKRAIFVSRRKDILRICFVLKFIELHGLLPCRPAFAMRHEPPPITEDVHAELGPPYSTVALFVPLLEISLCLEYLGV